MKINREIYAARIEDFGKMTHAEHYVSFFRQPIHIDGDCIEVPTPPECTICVDQMPFLFPGVDIPEIGQVVKITINSDVKSEIQ